MKLITVIARDAALLPHFLNHYSVLGVRQFIIGVYEDFGVTNAVRECAKAYSHFISHIPGSYSGVKDTAVRRALCKTFVMPKEWWVVADLDEFHEYPDQLPALCGKLERLGYDYLQSQFLDRVAPNGKSPALQASIGLWEQFPAGSYITRDLLGAVFTKLMLIRGHSPFGLGHHRPGPQSSGFAYRAGVVHHFKWFGDIALKMRMRRDRFRRNESRQYRKCDRFVRYWQHHGRLPIAGEFGFHYPKKPWNWPDRKEGDFLDFGLKEQNDAQ
jgi:hypothetical protein